MLDNQENLENKATKEEETTQNTPKENPVASEEKAEPKAEKKEEVPMPNYSNMDMEKLVEELEKMLKSNSVQNIKNKVDEIKYNFDSKFGELLKEKKEDFLKQGGNSIDFKFSSPLKTEYNKLLVEYKEKRKAYHRELENELKANLEKRNQVIEELKTLIDEAHPDRMYNDFQKLQTRWKSIGNVPKPTYNDTWKTYHHHVERFYDLLHLNNDFRELEFKHNLEKKLKLIEKTEYLASHKDINYAFKELQELHRLWKEEIGPVAKEHRESVWGKFSNLTKKIHDRRHSFFKEQKAKIAEIITAKELVIDEIEAYETEKNKTHKDWQKSIKDIEALRKKFFNCGKLPYNRSEEVWQKFKKATKKFNAKKNEFYKEEKQKQNENLKKKAELIEIAESIKDNEVCDETTNEMKRIQASWKEIGHVPKKFSNEIWTRFKTACNYYFDRLYDKKSEFEKKQDAVVIAKKEYLNNFKYLNDLTKESVQEKILEWKNIGVLPRNARHIEGKFFKAVDKHLGKLNLDKQEIEIFKFKNLVDSYLDQEDFRKLDSEQLFIRRKIDETVREMQQLENNLSFISNATADNPLVKNVRAGIQNFKDELDIWQAKLDYLKRLNY